MDKKKELVLAAQACGINHQGIYYPDKGLRLGQIGDGYATWIAWWNPLHNSADAFEILCALPIDVQRRTDRQGEPEVVLSLQDPAPEGQDHIILKNPSPADWREAIVELAVHRASYEANRLKAQEKSRSAQEPQSSGVDQTDTRCWCLTCRPLTMQDMRMTLCPECGNKRCPKANNHQNTCTGSNAPGQPGSAYP